MAITYHAGRRIQGIAGVDVADSFTSTTNPSSAALSLGGGSGSGNTKVGFEVQTGHFLVNKGLKTLTFALDKYGTVSGNGYVAVYNSSGTQKGSNSSTYNLGTLTQWSSPVDYTFTWTTPITIANGDRIVLEGGTFNTSNQVDLYSDNSSASEAYVNGVYFNSGWNSLSGTDVHFDVTTETNNGDTKPTNVQVGSRWEETDTRKMYDKESNEYKIHTFTSSGTFAVTGSGDVEYLVVAGGGGGYCGGGGAGGMRTGTLSVSAGNKTVTVGAGGYSGQCNVNGHGNNGVGGNSVFDSITSTGGGFGGGTGGNNNTAGGSGGGAGGKGHSANIAGGVSTASPNQGNDGGSVNTTDSKSGGGGGAGVKGDDSPNMDGGNGLVSLISGSSVIYAGGGAGAITNSASGGSGGSGGGGNYNTAGTTNLGAGGGGADSGRRAGYGGSGIVIVRYLTSSGITATGGTITTYSGWKEIGS